MTIKFYAGSGSPVVWRVWLALEHKALSYELKMLSFQAGDLRKPEFQAITPRGKVPVIVDEDFTLYESSAIVEYLNERYPDAGHGNLFPGDVQQRALIRRTICEIDCYLMSLVGSVGRQIFSKPKEEWDQASFAETQDKIITELANFEKMQHGEYFLEQLSAVDYTLYPILAILPRMEKTNPQLKMTPAVGKKLQAWMKRIEELPFFAKTYPPHWK